MHPLAIRSLIQNERRAIALRDDPLAADAFMDLLCGREPAVRGRVFAEPGVIGPPRGHGGGGRGPGAVEGWPRGAAQHGLRILQAMAVS